jgi:hypothetical protein
MKIHCLYRDFFVFLRMINLERNTWTAFKRYYYDKHTEFLSYLWHAYQGYSTRNIRERASVIKKEDYADIENLLKIYDIEEKTREILLHCKSLHHDHDRCNVYLVIGFFSPDAFVLCYRDKFVLCVGLERFHSFNLYDILLAHEYFHYIQNKVYGPISGPLALQLIREGICVQFSKIAFPGRKEHEYVLLSEQVFASAEKSYTLVIKRLKSRRIRREQLFSASSGDLPPRMGYYVGYRLVSEFFKETGIIDPSVLLGREKQILMDFMEK